MSTIMEKTLALSAHGGVQRNQNNSITQHIYSLIRDGNYAEAIRSLTIQLQSHPNSRAALSLLAYCYYYIQDFASAAEQYSTLAKLYPEVTDYQVNLAQCYYKAGQYEDAHKAAAAVTAPEYAERMTQLQAAIRYVQDDVAGTQAFLAQADPASAETLVALGGVQFKEGKYEDALKSYEVSVGMIGHGVDMMYNMAVCHYRLGQFTQAMQLCNDIIEKGVREHPELSVGSNAENGDVRSVGNTLVLRTTCLLEAFNLKMAIEYVTKNTDAAVEALHDMPPREEEELDPVTLHNTALCDMLTDPSTGFRKLQHLLRNPPHPPETLGNLVLLYVKHQLLDLAADALADYEDLHESCLSPQLKDYLSSLVEGHGSEQGQAEAYRKLELQAAKCIDVLRRRAKGIQDARHSQDEGAIREALAAYDTSLDEYIPVLMAQAKIYWDREHYAMVERIFKQSAEFCSDHAVWKLNVAHVFFMQEDKYRDAIRYYEPLVHKHMETSILEVSAIVLANLCVAYIMTSQNDSAAEIMREIEREEKRLASIDPSKSHHHLCIVNLVIGTLYCAKGNFEFGIDRVLKSLDPLPEKLSADTWYHAKRCFLALADTAAKQMLVIKDQFYEDIMSFLSGCEQHGQDISANLGTADGAQPSAEALTAASAAKPEFNVKDAPPRHLHTVAYEARLLMKLFLNIRGW